METQRKKYISIHRDKKRQTDEVRERQRDRDR